MQQIFITNTIYHQLAVSCNSGSFLGFPTWYKYLDTQSTLQQINANETVAVCQAQLKNINDIWLVVAAIIEILLRVGALVSIGFIIWGGIQFMTSQGDPNGVKTARETITNALIGLVITIMATVVVNFIAGSFN